MIIDLNTAIFIGLSLTIIFLFYYILAREKVSERKFRLIEMSVEELNQDLFQLKKKKVSDVAALTQVIPSKNDEELEELFEMIKESKRRHEVDVNRLEEKIESLEKKLKNAAMSEMTLPSATVDQNKIKALLEKGDTIEEISKKLGIGTGELLLILKMNDI